MDKTLLISSADKQIRAALLEGQELIEFFIDQDSTPSLVGNIYRGIIEDIVPGLEAAFVNIGMERKAFLHFADLIPESLEIGKRKKVITEQVKAQLEAAKAGAPPSATAPARGPRGRKGGHPRHNGGLLTDWAKILTPRTPAMVQVMKDGFGEKAPRITANISLPGRLMVLLPFPTQSGGISKRISSPQERQRLKRILKALGSKNYSFIIRTAGMTASDDELEKDATELKRLWQTILRRYRAAKTEKLLLDDQNIFLRLARDVLTPDVTRILVDDPQAAHDMKGALEYTFPDKAALVTEYKDELPLFDKYDVTKMVRRAVAPKVWLRKGGQIVIDETEALTTIDINSGRFISKENQEKTILETNLEACKSIAQHIRLRDLSGIIIVDFIDMLQESSRQKVEAEFRRWLRRDRAKMAIGGFSDFGIFLLTRKRRRTSLMQQMTQPCPYCEGGGRLMNKIEIWRNIKQGMIQAASGLKKRRDAPLIALMVHPQMVGYVHERFEDVLETWKRDWGVEDIWVIPAEEFHLEEFHIQALDKGAAARKALQLKARPRREATAAAGGPPPAPVKTHERADKSAERDDKAHRKDFKKKDERDKRATTASQKPHTAKSELSVLANSVPDMPTEESEQELEVELDVIAEPEDGVEAMGTVNAGDETSATLNPVESPETIEQAGEPPALSSDASAASSARKKRRGRRGGRGRRRGRNGAADGATPAAAAAGQDSGASTPAAKTEAKPVETSAKSAEPKESVKHKPATAAATSSETQKTDAGSGAAKPAPKRRRGTRGGRGRKKPAGAKASADSSKATSSDTKGAAKEAASAAAEVATEAVT